MKNAITAEISQNNHLNFSSISSCVSFICHLADILFHPTEIKRKCHYAYFHFANVILPLPHTSMDRIKCQINDVIRAGRQD